MTALFRLMLKMSITASYVIAVVLILRLLMRRFPRKYSYYLWSAVLFRLCCPFSFSSVLSIFNFSAKRGEDVIIDLSGVPVAPSATEGVIGSIDLGSPFITEVVKETFATPEQNIMVNPAAPQPAVPVVAPIAESAARPDLFTVLAFIWLIGVAVMAVYALISYLKLKKELDFAVPFHDDVKQADVQSPFLLGLIKPTIYIPFDIDESALTMSLAHERYHLLRKDNWVRALSYCLLCIHWMNPMCWVAFFLMIKDMEMSCDEYVLAGKEDIRAKYSNALLGLATEREAPIMATISFGGDNVKERIKNIMRFKHTSKIISAIGALLCVATLVVCIFNGKANAMAPEGPSSDQTTEEMSGPISEDVEETFEYGPIRLIGKPIGAIMGEFAKTSKGYYEILPWTPQMLPEEQRTNYKYPGNIIYTDYETGTTDFLCSVPGCDHNSPDCTSFIENAYCGHLFTDYSENHLFLMLGGAVDDQSGKIGEPARIIEMNMDGSEKRTVCVLNDYESFDDWPVVVAGDEYVYTTTIQRKLQNGYSVDRPLLERIWFADGRREVIRELKNDNEDHEVLFSSVNDSDLVIRHIHRDEEGTTDAREWYSQSGELLETYGPYSAEYYAYCDSDLLVHLTSDGSTLTATAFFPVTQKKMMIQGIPCDADPSRCVILERDDEKMMLHFIDKDGISRNYVLDFSNETWKEFSLTLDSNNAYEVTPLADAGDDYLVVADRYDSTIYLKDTEGVEHAYTIVWRMIYAFMSKDDYWNSVPNFRYIEDKLD